MDEAATRGITLLSEAGARRALRAARQAAGAGGPAVVICVTDAFGHAIATLRMDGAPVVSIALSEAKARTAAQLGVPTANLQALVDSGAFSILSADGLVPLEGGVPILMAGAVIGAVGVSGADAASDGRIARAGADALETDV